MKSANGLTRMVAGAAIIAAAISIWGCSDPNAPEVSGVTTYDRVIVYQTSQAPPSNNVRDVIWDAAPTAVVTIGDSTTGYPYYFGKQSINIKAIKAENRLFVRVTWTDNSYSVWPDKIRHAIRAIDTVNHDTILWWVPRASENFNGSTLFYFQDRLAIFWDTGDNGTEKADCKSMCHESPNAQGNHMYTTGGGHVDVWHWKAATTDPLLLASDEYWDNTGHVADAGDSLATVNYDNPNNLPLRCGLDSTAFNKAFLFNDESMPFPDSAGWKLNDSIPGYVLNHSASGSITDVRAFSSYVLGYTNGSTGWNGRWIVALSRALNTGNADDRDFSGIKSGDSIMATIAIANNGPDTLHSGTKPIYFIFP